MGQVSSMWSHMDTFFFFLLFFLPSESVSEVTGELSEEEFLLPELSSEEEDSLDEVELTGVGDLLLKHKSIKFMPLPRA